MVLLAASVCRTIMLRITLRIIAKDMSRRRLRGTVSVEYVCLVAMKEN